MQLQGDRRQRRNVAGLALERPELANAGAHLRQRERRRCRGGAGELSQRRMRPLAPQPLAEVRGADGQGLAPALELLEQDDAAGLGDGRRQGRVLGKIGSLAEDQVDGDGAGAGPVDRADRLRLHRPRPSPRLERQAQRVRGAFVQAHHRHVRRRLDRAADEKQPAQAERLLEGQPRRRGDEGSAAAADHKAEGHRPQPLAASGRAPARRERPHLSLPSGSRYAPVCRGRGDAATSALRSARISRREMP